MIALTDAERRFIDVDMKKCNLSETPPDGLPSEPGTQTLEQGKYYFPKALR